MRDSDDLKTASGTQSAIPSVRTDDRGRVTRAPRPRTLAWLIVLAPWLETGIAVTPAAEIPAATTTTFPERDDSEGTFLAAVFGETRLPDADLLVLRDGRRWTGTVANTQITLRTAAGGLSVLLPQIAGIEWAGPTETATVVRCINNDRLSGVLEPMTLEWRPAEGAHVRLRSEAVARLIRRGRPGEANALPAEAFVVLKNGDAFAAGLSTNTFVVVTGGTNRVVRLDAMASVRFSADHPAVAQIALRDGPELVADWPAEDIDVTLAVGPGLRLYRDGIETIYCQAGFRPPEYRLTAASRGEPGRTFAGLVWIAPGRFVMGSPNEEPGRDFDEAPLTEVTLTRGFWMGACEVTQAEFKAVMATNPSQFVEDPALPVERVNWREAARYCEELTRRWTAERRLPDGYAFRLPTEAEWECACRAGTTTRFSHGEDPDGRRLGEFAWFGENSDSMTHRVGSRRPNPWGLYDLHGNVLEWCLDAAGPYPGGSVTDPVGQTGRALLRIARGGSWLYGANAARSANRDSYSETTRCSDVGFRVVLAPVTIGRP